MLVDKGAKVKHTTNVDDEVKGSLEFDSRRVTALSIAAETGNVEIAEYLIEKGANVNVLDINCENMFLYVSQSRDDEYYLTPLHRAISFKHPDMIRLLIEKGADVDMKNTRGKTPLMLAKEKGYTEAVNILLKAGAR